MKIRFLIVSFAFAAVLSACSSHTSDQFSSLSDQGPLPVSGINAFVGSNLFLADEFSKSGNLFQFFKARGAPQAIELKSHFNKEELRLYYPIDKEYYVAELVTDDSSHEWITRGPYQIDRKEYRSLSRLFEEGSYEPQFVFRGKPFKFKGEILLTGEAVPTPIPMPRIVHKPKVKSGKLTTKLADSSNNAIKTAPAEPTPFKPLTFDQQAIMMSQGYAERTPNGDVVHTIKGEGESIEKIAGWYTGNPAGGKELLKENGLVEGTALKPGTRIQIPMKDVKQFKRMQ